MSKKRARLLRRRQAMLRAIEDVWCQAAHLVPEVACEGPIDPHEPLTRARGGSIVERSNIVLVCRAHHGWVHRHPDDAHTLGLLVHSWESR